MELLLGQKRNWDDTLCAFYTDSIDLKGDDINTKMWYIIGADWEAIGYSDMDGVIGTGIFTEGVYLVGATLDWPVAAGVIAVGGIAASATELNKQLRYIKAFIIWLPWPF